MAFQYLYDLGHRDILYVTSNPRRNANIRRKEGFCDACMEKHLAVNLFDVLADEPAINLMADSALGNLSQSYEIGRTFFEKGFHKRFSAVLAGSDLIAIGILQAAYEYNVKVPEELSVMGYDDISFSGLPGINLTTIRQPIKDVADICVTELVSAIREERKVAVDRRIQPTLVVRNSCRKI